MGETKAEKELNPSWIESSGFTSLDRPGLCHLRGVDLPQEEGKNPWIHCLNLTHMSQITLVVLADMLK